MPDENDSVPPWDADEQQTEMKAEASINKEDLLHDDEGPTGRFKVVRFQISTSVFHMDHWEEGILGDDITLFFHGAINKDRYRSTLSLTMSPARARELAEAILANEVVSSQRN